MKKTVRAFRTGQLPSASHETRRRVGFKLPARIVDQTPKKKPEEEENN